ncbi:DUF223 domain-containing protein [Abeliophyllum distichum]|uniref:DUF223 domain-containing protein n=1 Tax=Abeliophyllum distichum TaxID=126358 RepID=A0ABD1R021_9LAMI
MAPIFDFVQDIDTTKTSWAIKVHVVRVYEQMRYTNPKEVFSLDFVSHDKEKSGIDSIPAEIEALVDREVLFKVQIRDQNINFPKAAYTVTRVTEDANMISKYVKNNGNHYSDILSKIEKTEVDDEKVSSSSDEVTTPIKKSTTIDHSGDMREGSVTKRSLAGELSSNVAEKKLKSVVKQENE